MSDAVNIVTLGMDAMLPTAVRRLSTGKLEARHFQLLPAARITNFARAFKESLTMESAKSWLDGLRFEFVVDRPRAFSPRTSLVFDPLWAVPGFSDDMTPIESIAVCRKLLLSSINETFEMLESDKPAMFLLHLPEPVPTQTIYGRVVSPILAVNPAAKRSFYLMSPIEYPIGVSRLRYGFHTIPCPPPGDPMSVAMPRVMLAVQHFLGG